MQCRFAPCDAGGCSWDLLRSLTIGQRMERDLDALLPLPAAAYDACDQPASRVSSLSLVRYRTNDYSVPVAYGHRDVLVKGYVDRVVISCGAEIIARHPRSYEQGRFHLRPHPLPAVVGTEDRGPGPGRALGGMEIARGVCGRCAGSWKPGWASVASGNSYGCSDSWRISLTRRSTTPCRTPCAWAPSASTPCSTCCCAALKAGPNRLDLDFYPDLPQISVKTTRAGDYLTLLSGRAA